MSILVLQIIVFKIELVALLGLSSCCLMMVERLFLAVPWGCLRFVIVVFPDHTHLLFFYHAKIWSEHDCPIKIIPLTFLWFVK